MLTNHPHPTEETLENWLLNRAPESEATAVEEHLLVCSRCIVEASRLEEEIGMLRSTAV